METSDMIAIVVLVFCIVLGANKPTFCAFNRNFNEGAVFLLEV